MATIYQLGWPGMELLPCIIVDQETHEMFHMDKPLPAHRSSLAVPENKYVEFATVLSHFDADNQAHAMHMFMNVSNEFNLRKFFMDNRQKAYISVETLLVYILVYPKCQAFLKARNQVINYLHEWLDYPCLECGFIKRSGCFCTEDNPCNGQKTEYIGYCTEQVDRQVQTDVTGNVLNSTLPLGLPPLGYQQPPMPPIVTPFLAGAMGRVAHVQPTQSTFTAPSPTLASSLTGATPAVASIQPLSVQTGAVSLLAGLDHRALARPVQPVAPLVKPRTREIGVQTRANFDFSQADSRTRSMARQRPKVDPNRPALADGMEVPPTPQTPQEATPGASQDSTGGLTPLPGSTPVSLPGTPMTGGVKLPEATQSLTTSTPGTSAIKVSLWKLLDSDSEDEESKPSSSEDKPNTSEEKPNIAEAESSTSEEKPSNAEAESSTSEEKPNNAEPESSTSEEKQSNAEEKTSPVDDKTNTTEENSRTTEVQKKDISEKDEKQTEVETTIPDIDQEKLGAAETLLKMLASNDDLERQEPPAPSVQAPTEAADLETKADEKDDAKVSESTDKTGKKCSPIFVEAVLSSALEKVQSQLVANSKEPSETSKTSTDLLVQKSNELESGEAVSDETEMEVDSPKKFEKPVFVVSNQPSSSSTTQTPDKESTDKPEASQEGGLGNEGEEEEEEGESRLTIDLGSSVGDKEGEEGVEEGVEEGEEARKRREEAEKKRQEQELVDKMQFKKWHHRFEYTPTQEKLYRCTFRRCGQCFDTKAAAVLHNRCHGVFGQEDSNNLMCYKCSYSTPLSRWFDMMRHLKDAHDDIVTREPLGCFFCGQTLPDEDQLFRHMDFHYMGRYKCVYCGTLGFTWKQVEEHVRSHCEQRGKRERHLGCPYCPLVFHLRNMRSAHMLAHTDQGLRCCFCKDDMEWNNWTDLRKHYQQKHGDRIKSAIGHRSKAVNINIFKVPECHVCSHESKTMEDYIYHMRKRHDFIPYTMRECQVCEKTFKSEKMFDWHMKHTHGNEIRCPKCDYVASNDLQLKQHEESQHQSREYECMECGKEFSRYHQLRQHMAHHALHTIYNCKQCGAEFKRQRELRSHMKKVHPPDEESSKHKCPDCDYEFFNKRSLEQHIRRAHPALAEEIQESEEISSAPTPDHGYSSAVAPPSGPPTRTATHPLRRRRPKRMDPDFVPDPDSVIADDPDDDNIQPIEPSPAAAAIIAANRAAERGELGPEAVEAAIAAAAAAQEAAEKTHASLNRTLPAGEEEGEEEEGAERVDEEFKPPKEPKPRPPRPSTSNKRRGGKRYKYVKKSKRINLYASLDEIGDPVYSDKQRQQLALRQRVDLLKIRIKETSVRTRTYEENHDLKELKKRKRGHVEEEGVNQTIVEDNSESKRPLISKYGRSITQRTFDDNWVPMDQRDRRPAFRHRPRAEGESVSPPATWMDEGNTFYPFTDHCYFQLEAQQAPVQDPSQHTANVVQTFQLGADGQVVSTVLGPEQRLTSLDTRRKQRFATVAWEDGGGGVARYKRTVYVLPPAKEWEGADGQVVSTVLGPEQRLPSLDTRRKQRFATGPGHGGDIASSRAQGDVPHREEVSLDDIDTALIQELSQVSNDPLLQNILDSMEQSSAGQDSPSKQRQQVRSAAPPGSLPLGPNTPPRSQASEALGADAGLTPTKQSVIDLLLSKIEINDEQLNRLIEEQSRVAGGQTVGQGEGAGQAVGQEIEQGVKHADVQGGVQGQMQGQSVEHIDGQTGGQMEGQEEGVLISLEQLAGCNVVGITRIPQGSQLGSQLGSQTIQQATTYQQQDMSTVITTGGMTGTGSDTDSNPDVEQPDLTGIHHQQPTGVAVDNSDITDVGVTSQYITVTSQHVAMTSQQPGVGTRTEAEQYRALTMDDGRGGTVRRLVRLVSRGDTPASSSAPGQARPQVFRTVSAVPSSSSASSGAASTGVIVRSVKPSSMGGVGPVRFVGNPNVPQRMSPYSQRQVPGVTRVVSHQSHSRVAHPPSVRVVTGFPQRSSQLQHTVLRSPGVSLGTGTMGQVVSVTSAPLKVSRAPATTVFNIPVTGSMQGTSLEDIITTSTHSIQQPQP